MDEKRTNKIRDIVLSFELLTDQEQEAETAECIVHSFYKVIKVIIMRVGKNALWNVFCSL